MVKVMRKKIFYSWFFVVGCSLGINAAVADPNQSTVIVSPAN
jgi:hypothetical protein